MVNAFQNWLGGLFPQPSSTGGAPWQPYEQAFSIQNGKKVYGPQFSGEQNQPLTQQQYTQQYGAPGAPLPSTPVPGPAPSRNTGLDPHINPSTGVWDDNYFAASQPKPSATDIARQQYEQGQRSSINTGWDAYTNQLNEMLNTNLPSQRSALEGTARLGYEQNLADLSSQKTSAIAETERGQAKNLKSLAENVRNMFEAGNVYLGARGAGDSSAAEQYSYALNKMATRQSGDIRSAATERLSKINDIYNNESNRSKTDYDTKINQISQWFNEAQNSLRQNIGQAGLGRSRDLQGLSQNVYNLALQELQKTQQEYQNRRSTLETWAMNNSKNAQELSANIRTLGAMPEYQQLVGGMPQMEPQSSTGAPIGYAGGTSKRITSYDIFGQPRYG